MPESFGSPAWEKHITQTFALISKALSSRDLAHSIAAIESVSQKTCVFSPKRSREEGQVVLQLKYSISTCSDALPIIRGNT